MEMASLTTLAVQTKLRWTLITVSLFDFKCLTLVILKKNCVQAVLQLIHLIFDF